MLSFFFALLFYSQTVVPCTIYPDKGVNSITVQTSEFADVQKEFGMMKVEKKWIKKVEFFAFGTGGYNRFIQYDTLGMNFSSFASNKKERTNTIQTILITENCSCKTEKEIGIGSSVEQLEIAYGKDCYKSVEPGRELAIYYNRTYFYVDSFEPTGKIVKIKIF